MRPMTSRATRSSLWSEQEKNRFLGAALVEALVEDGHAVRAVVEAAGDHDRPDLELRIDGKPVHVELVRYLQQSELLAIERDAHELHRRLEEKLYTDPPTQALKLYIRYRAGVTGQWLRRVPPASQRDDFEHECTQMLKDLSGSEWWNSVGEVSVSFLEDLAHSTSPLLLSPRKCHWIARTTDYPTLSQWCELVTVVKAPRGAMPSVHCLDLSSRVISANTKVVSQTMQKKLDKVPAYRSRANGASIWLVIHSGWSFERDIANLGALIDPCDLDEQCAEAGIHLGRKEDSFDAAYWLDRGLGTVPLRLLPIAIVRQSR